MPPPAEALNFILDLGPEVILRGFQTSTMDYFDTQERTDGNQDSSLSFSSQVDGRRAADGSSKEVDVV